MRKSTLAAVMITVLFVQVGCGISGEPVLRYKMAPGETWQAILISHTEVATDENKKDENAQQTKTTFEYKVSAGPKKDWVKLTARIVSQKTPEGTAPMDLSGITYTAEMHRTGEIRNIEHTGSVKTPGAEGQELPPQVAAMMAQSNNMIADMWKGAVFWFPELPEEALEAGDEFTTTRRLGAGSSGAGVQVNSTIKQVFILDEIKEGLAYFDVKERHVTTTGSAAGGGKADTKGAGKGEGVFDVREGMWTELTMKSASTVEMGGFLGMGAKSHKVLNINKITIEKK